MDRTIIKKKWTTRRIIMASLLALLPLGTAYAIFGADHSSKLNLEKDRLLIAEVKKENFEEYISVDGTVLPLESVYLDAVEGGVIEKKTAEQGEMLNAGDTILVLSNSDLQLDYVNRETQILELLNQIESARLTLKQSQIRQQNELADMKYQLQQSDRKLKVNKALAEQQAVSKNEYQQIADENEYLKEKMEIARRSLRQDSILSTTQINQMDFSVKRMKQNLALVKKNLEHLVVRAPLTGQLTSFDLQKGQLLQKGQNIGQIDVNGGYKIRASIDEHYISRIYAGQKGSVSFNEHTYEMTVNKVNPQVKNGFFEADLVFGKDIPEDLRKGQNMSVKLGLSSQSQAVVLNRGNFAQSTGGSWVFVLNSDGTEAERREIKTGRQNPQYFEILEGLQEGDKVIVSSYNGFEDKEKLILK